jgi:ATP-dependent exoDNAse (exonuclease V) beta subunit
MGGRTVSRLRFISAGAGSGKTFTLTNILGDELQKGRVKPGGVIATTFTVKAATELRERVRQHLLGHELFDLANAMGQARIGTVNSVCGELLERFAFENGLAPALHVIDEDQSKVLMRKTVDEVLSAGTIDAMEALSWRLGIEDWKSDLRTLVMEVRANRIDPASLPSMATRNAQSFLEKFGQPYAEDLSEQLMTGIESVLRELKPHLDKDKVAKVTRDYHQLVLNFRRDLRNARAPWAQWIKLSKAKPGKKALTPGVGEVGKLAGMCTAHPMLHEDISTYLTLLFEACASIIQGYQARKKELGVVDFTDQEALFLEMLDNPDVTAVLSEELDLLLVDEFQDTSPMQLALFLKLSTFARQCFFVGDIKQAIYGFRGSSPELMQRLLQVFPEIGGDVMILDKSWRSRPPLVALVNAVFRHAFAETIPEAEVVLAPQRKEVVDSPAFANWVLEGGNTSDRFQALAAGVRELVASGMHVPDGSSGKTRPVRYGDIAVLTRSNEGVDDLARSLRGAGVPVATASAGLLKTPEAALALACLRRINDRGDTVATAEILSLAECSEPEAWLTDRLRYIQGEHDPKGWLETGPGAHPLLARIAELRTRLDVLTPHEALRMLVMECDLPTLVMQWCGSVEMARLRMANLEALVDLAEQYQLACRSLREAVTISGFFVWLQEVGEAGNDAMATPALDAVTVMTCHKAKGLEWPVVILAELEKNVRSGVWSISALSGEGFTAEDPLAGRNIHYWPWPFGKQSTGIDVLGAIESSQEYTQSLALNVEEAKRLLYVGMTRARDLLILTHNTRARSERPWIRTLDADWMMFGNVSDPFVLPDGKAVPYEERVLASEDRADQNETGKVSLRWYKAATDRHEYPALFVTPSGVEGRAAAIIERHDVGAPMQVKKGIDRAVIGSAIHACLAVSFTDSSVPLSEEEIQEILAGFGVAEALSASETGRQIAALHAWVRSRWPQATVRAEVPVTCENGVGQIVHGWIDLLVESPDGCVIIDHKSSTGKASRLQEIAEEYSVQLDLYASAVEVATGKKVLGKWLFLPVLGIVICVE